MSDQHEDELGEAALSEEYIAVEKRLRKAEEARQDLERSGWVSSGPNELCHPDDPRVNVWFNPYTGERLLSPELVVRLRQGVELERERGTLLGSD